MPSYAMHTMQLPVLLTKCGGMGLRDMALFNTAILAKKGWGFLTRRSALWVQVLRGKYVVTRSGQLCLVWRYWLFWGWRNKGLFEQDFVRPRDEVRAIHATAHSFEQARDLRSNTSQPRREWRWIRWRRPPPRLVKVNTNGALRGNPGIVGAGGLLRNDDGYRICRFLHNVGFATSTTAELWGALVGLQLAWDHGYRHVVLELDSQVVQRLLSDGATHNQCLESLVSSISDILHRD
ncbi:hypothetical protein CRG98_015164 [Punica granatum]|uniref:RNase H type-1 domain-containing protein n=1 Tax=Punica granatum TaxID=22663 RepID=A0A2I0K7A9_PUNGR|nr:hypothetical protein CRG98_015164 [Punica granatum]